MECATGEQRRKSRAVRPSATDWIAAYSVPCTPRSEHRRATAPRSGGDAWPPQEAPTRCSARSVAAGLFIGGATLARGPPHTPPVRVTLRRFPKLSTLLSRPQEAFDGLLDSENGCVTTRSGSAADLDTTLGRLQLAHAPVPGALLTAELFRHVTSASVGGWRDTHADRSCEASADSEPRAM